LLERGEHDVHQRSQEHCRKYKPNASVAYHCSLIARRKVKVLPIIGSCSILCESSEAIDEIKVNKKTNKHFWFHRPLVVSFI
jgi:hypothetical protein